MIENGFEVRDIVRDMSLLGFSESTIKKRLKLLSEHNVRRPKPWMLKCSADKFQRFYRHFLLFFK